MDEGTPILNLSSLRVLLFKEVEERLMDFHSISRWCGLHNVTIVERVSEAVKYVISEDFDLIFVTHFGDARRTTRFLKELSGIDAVSGTPVIAITGDPSVKTALGIMAKGVSAIMVSPLSRSVVEDTIRKALNEQIGSDSTRERLDRARALLKADRVDEAGDIYLSFVFQGITHIDAYLGLSAVDCRKGRWREALLNIKKALKLVRASETKIESHRQLSRIMQHYGIYYEGRRQLDEAIKAYRTSLSMNPYNIDSIRALLNLLQKRDAVDDMVKVIRKAQSNLQPYTDPMEEIAVCVDELAGKYLSLDMPVQARKLYERLASLPHENIQVHLRVVDFFERRGHISFALNYLLKLCEKVRDPDVLYKLGSLLLDSMKRFMSGGTSAAKPGKAESADLSFFQAHSRSQVLSLAQKVLHQGLLIEPDDERFWLAVARCRLRLKEEQSAVEVLTRLRGAHTNDLDFQVHVIEILIDEGAYDQASRWLRESIALYPREIRFYQLNARLCHEQKQYFDAIGFLKRGLAMETDNTEILISLAESYHAAGQYSDSIAYYEKAARLLPEDPRIREGMSEALKKKYQ